MTKGRQCYLYLIKIETPIGEMVAGATDNGICLFEFTDRQRAQRELKDLKKLLKLEVAEKDNSHLLNLKKQVNEYFSGSRKEFELPLVTPGTDFQNLVWKELLTIPFGTTRSYLEQSQAIGQPEAIRAVAGANGMNRISIIIPCHRVIGSDGRLTGYGGGLGRKKWLLDHERKFSGKPVEQKLF
jgi:AraC family transcriptional regulator of adaptative response/methylated-DNA-[protein]-cysteine methyltransferase